MTQKRKKHTHAQAYDSPKIERQAGFQDALMYDSFHPPCCDEVRYLELFTQIPWGIAFFQPVNDGQDYILTAINPTFEKIIGRTESSMIHHSIREIMLESDLEKTVKSLAAAYERQIPVRFKLSVSALQEDEDGGENTVFPMRNGELALVFAQESIYERLQQNMERESSSTQVLLDVPSSAAMLISLDKTIKEVNRTVCILLGKTREELLGSIFYSFMPPQTAQKRIHYFDTAVESGEVQRFEDECRGLWYDNIMNPVRNEDGNVVEIAFLAHDITEQKRQAILQKEQLQKLIQADKMVALGTLVGGVAHEINNPNHIIGLNAPMLQDIWKSTAPILEKHYQNHGNFSVGGFAYTDVEETAPNLIEGIIGSSKRIQTIVEELRNFARFQPASMQDLVDLNAVVKSATTLLSNSISRATQQFKAIYGLDVPVFRGDSKRIQQVVIRLIQNACQALTDYSQAIIVYTRYYPKEEVVVTEVRDEGEGIPRDLIDKVLNPFFTTRGDQGGVGLGLSIASTIVEDHGGRLNIESTEGIGTKVRFSIPVGSIDINEDGEES